MSWSSWAMFFSGLFAGWGLGVLTVCLLAKSGPDLPDDVWRRIEREERE